MKDINVIKVLHQVGLPATPARILTLQIFDATYKRFGVPLDAQDLISNLQKDLGKDRATVFRILNTFVEKGLIRKLEFGEGKARYELATREDHHHLICEQCGRIEDVEDNVIPALEKHIASKHRFTVKKHSLEFFGICEQCQKKGTN